MGFTTNNYKQIVVAAKNAVKKWKTADKTAKACRTELAKYSIEVKSMEMNMTAFARQIGLGYTTMRAFIEEYEGDIQLDKIEKVMKNKLTEIERVSARKKIRPGITTKDIFNLVKKEVGRTPEDRVMDNLIPHLTRIKDNLQAYSLIGLDHESLIVILELCTIITNELDKHFGVVYDKKRSSKSLLN